MAASVRPTPQPTSSTEIVPGSARVLRVVSTRMSAFTSVKNPTSCPENAMDRWTASPYESWNRSKSWVIGLPGPEDVILDTPCPARSGGAPRRLLYHPPDVRPAPEPPRRHVERRPQPRIHEGDEPHPGRLIRCGRRP